MIRVTFRHPDGVAHTYAFPGHWGVRTEEAGNLVYVFGRREGSRVEGLLGSVHTQYFVAATEAQDEMMTLAEAVGVTPPSLDELGGFQDPMLARNVHTLLDGMGRRRTMTGHLEESPVVSLGDRRRLAEQTDEEKE